MAKVFNDYSREQLKYAIDNFNWKRKVTSIAMHHTWQPNHSQWQGEKSMMGMWNYHVNTNKWSDIAQHLTIAPDGRGWSGRDWNQSPASSNGFNGNTTEGPFMFEMVGDFDKGKDILEAEQLETVLFTVAYLQHKFDLPLRSLKFHRHLNSPKTCPGSGIDYEEFLKVLEEYKLNVLPSYL